MVFFIGIFGLIISFPPLQGKAILGDDFKEDFEGIVYPEWKTTGLWHLEDNTTSDWPINSWIPSNSHYMWYGSNQSGYYDTGSRNNGTLISEQLDLTVFSGEIKLGFWSWAITEADPYDCKNVSISPDGGITWNLLGYIQNNSVWQYFSFDITEFGYSSNVMIRFYFDTVDGSLNFYRGWMIDDIEIKEKPGYFELFIYQENYALLGETRLMNFSIYSYFNYGMGVNISIILTSPSGYNETLKECYFEYILSHGSWNHSLNYTFQEVGYYDVHLILTDDLSLEWKEYSWWDIGPVLDLWIEQDHYTYIDSKEWMDFKIESHSAHGTDVNISIIIHTPNGDEKILHKETTYIAEFGYWEKSLSYIFTEEGYYEVFLILVDDIGNEWNADCWWKVEKVDDSMPSDEKDADQTDMISPGFEGIFILGVLAISTIFIRKRNKRLL